MAKKRVIKKRKHNRSAAPLPPISKSRKKRK